MIIELNLDITDLEKDIESKKRAAEENKRLEIEKNKYYKELSNKYSEQLQIVAVDI